MTPEERARQVVRTVREKALNYRRDPEEIAVTEVAKALREVSPSWPRPIPVSERLPTDRCDYYEHFSVWVLVWCAIERLWQTAYYDYNAKAWDAGDNEWLDDVTHWMEMPPAPPEEKGASE